MKQNRIEEYEINSCTMFLKPIEYGSKIYTHVFEMEDEFISPFKPLDIIKKSCDYYGSDYESRKRGTRQLIGYNRKIPIAIEPANHIFFFPTTSPNRPECIWVSHDHVDTYRRNCPQQTLVIFRNKQSHQIPVSHSIFESQLLRTSLLKTKLMQRIENNEKKLNYYFLQKPKELKASEKAEEYENWLTLNKKK